MNQGQLRNDRRIRCIEELAESQRVFVFILDVGFVRSLADVDTAGRGDFTADGLLRGRSCNAFTGLLKLGSAQASERRLGSGTRKRIRKSSVMDWSNVYLL